MASRNTRKQATRIAVLAFVAADCAGVAYVQHRMARKAAAVEELAYAQPLVTPAAGSSAQVFTAAAPVLAVSTPVDGAAVTTVPAKTASAAPAARPVLAAAGPAVAPLATPVHHAAGLPALALGTDAPQKSLAHPLRAPRIAPVAGLGAAQLAVTAPAPALREAPVAHRHVATAVTTASAADSAFASAFTLSGEAPDSEHRFGQGEGAAASGNLADLVTPREEPAPIFDQAGIAPVTGQAAAAEAPALAPVDAPAAAPATDAVPATKG